MFKNLIRFTKSFTTPSYNTFATTSFRNKAPVHITITGASDRVGYSTIFRIANGDMLGKDQPVILHLFDTPESQEALEGLAMELSDCAFPLLNNVTFSDKYTESFKDTDYALIISSKSRGRDFAKEEAQTFIDIGKAINDNASRNVKVVVGGYPANRNCLITSHYAKDIPKENFTAMTRLGHNRALSQLATKTQSNVNDIDKLAIWGSQAPTMFPDLTHTTVKGKIASYFPDREWRCDRGQNIDILPSLDATGWAKKEFIHNVRDRDFHYIRAKTPKAAASVGSSLIDHMRDWVHGTNGKWTSMAVHSDGSYGIEPGFVFSYPVICENGKYEIVKGLEIEPEMFQISKEFLLWERQPIEDLLI